MNWCWRKILVMPVLTCFFSTSISDNTKFSEMKPGERTKAYKISSVKNFCREKGPIEHEDMATRTHSISFWTDQNSRFSVSLNPSLVPQPTCFWKWVGRTNPLKSGISTLKLIFTAKTTLGQAKWGIIGTVYALRTSVYQFDENFHHT